MNPNHQQVQIGNIIHKKNIEDFTCPVCLNDITDNKKKTQTSCGHLFCEDCVKTLPILKNSLNCVSCPMCRAKLIKYREEVELNKIPLSEIRKRLEKINRNVGYCQSRLEQVPEIVRELLVQITNVYNQQEITREYLHECLETQRLLQEQVNQRSRPRRNSVNPEPINL